MSKKKYVFNVTGLTKYYTVSTRNNQIIKQKIFENEKFYIFKNEICIITGKSGSGKSTLLHLLSTLDNPDKGIIEINYDYIFNRFNNENNSDNQNIFKSTGILNNKIKCNKDNFIYLNEQTESIKSEIRKFCFGFIFQEFHLIPQLTTLENVKLPLILAGIEKKDRNKIAKEHIDFVDLTDKCNYYPNELSGGEKQRVAIARALVLKPCVIFADEPTGNLDSANSKLIIELFNEIHKKRNLTLIIVTHDNDILNQFKDSSNLIINNGKIEFKILQ